MFLRRLWGDARIGYRSWAVGRIDDPVAAAYWRQCGVEPFNVPLEGFVQDLLGRLEGEPVAEVSM